MTRRFVKVLVVLTLTAPTWATASPSAALPSGFRAVSGAAAAGFAPPSDTFEVWSAMFPDGSNQTRYQQRVDGADVLGGQLTTVRAAGGTTLAVVGNHYPGLRPANTRRLNANAAHAIAAQHVGAGGRWETRLRLDPATALLFYETISQQFDHRWVVWVDADNGQVTRVFDAVAYDGPGIGVKGDTKTVDSSVVDDTNAMVTSDGRQRTYDIGNQKASRYYPGTLVTDPDDVWNTPGNTSPGHPAAVDAHVYAGVVDDFYLAVFGRDSFDDLGSPLISTVHYGRRYNNAFWNGEQMTYGDGDGTIFRELSGGLDVVGHELTHGVTQFTSGLIYADESGALNESFSDIMGNTIEAYAAEPLSSNCVLTTGQTVCPDWLVGEDIDVRSGATPGLRNMADPQEDEDPDHYDERYTGKKDNGGVHTNSGIPNHAFYLLVNGGKNAGCDTVGSDGHTHTLNCDTTVIPVDLATARSIFYLGFTSLPENANICNARQATIAVAGGVAPNVADAWTAVGVLDGCTSAPQPPSCVVANASIPFESDHPYAVNQDCTWTYDHGSPNFRLHFSLLDMETDFDFVYVTNGDAAQLHALTGRFREGFTTDCITTSTVDVRMVTDFTINKKGFTVDAAIAC